jgi:uncharacterized protein (TIGR00304 family)
MYLSQLLILLGIGIIILGFIILALALLIMSISKETYKEQKEDSETKVRGGGVVLIGPIPIVFGTDKQSLIIVLSLTIIIIILAIILLWGLR